MYEKEIENLKAIARNYPAGDQPTFDTAIALMRAAEPKDEAAERGHCLQAVNFIQEIDSGRSAVDRMMFERAAARAEGRTMRERLQTGNAELRGIVTQLREQLADETAKRFEVTRQARTVEAERDQLKAEVRRLLATK
jgi:regulator of replication initiation timing